jgi:hypothetical protein
MDVPSAYLHVYLFHGLDAEAFEMMKRLERILKHDSGRAPKE